MILYDIVDRHKCGKLWGLLLIIPESRYGEGVASSQRLSCHPAPDGAGYIVRCEGANSLYSFLESDFPNSSRRTIWELAKNGEVVLVQ